MRTLLIAVTAVVVVACGRPRDKWAGKPADVRQFLERTDAMTVDMPRTDVDRLLAGYPSSESNENRDEDRGGRPLARPSVLTVTYSNKPDANDFDYFIIAYFDVDGRLVGKSWGIYDK